MESWTVVELRGLKVPVNVDGVASTSRGLVGDTVFAVLPNVKPIHTFIITIAFQAVRLFLLSQSVAKGLVHNAYLL